VPARGPEEFVEDVEEGEAALRFAASLTLRSFSLSRILQSTLCIWGGGLGAGRG
jgi:hypothetical protein